MIPRFASLSACALLGLALQVSPALAQSRTVVHFQKGNDNAAATDTISSGAEVPKPTTTMPTRRAGMPK